MWKILEKILTSDTQLTFTCFFQTLVFQTLILWNGGSTYGNLIKVSVVNFFFFQFCLSLCVYGHNKKFVRSNFTDIRTSLINDLQLHLQTLFQLEKAHEANFVKSIYSCTCLIFTTLSSIPHYHKIYFACFGIFTGMKVYPIYGQQPQLL